MTQPPDKAQPRSERMTAEEIERYRRFLRLGSSLASDEADKLLDALTAAYAELDGARAKIHGLADQNDGLRFDLLEARQIIRELKEKK